METVPSANFAVPSDTLANGETVDFLLSGASQLANAAAWLEAAADAGVACSGPRPWPVRVLPARSRADPRAVPLRDPELHAVRIGAQSLCSHPFDICSCAVLATTILEVLPY